LAVSLIVVTFRPGEALRRFLETARKATSEPYEVLIVDNGPTDGASERVAADFAEARVLRSGGNIGYGRAANLGASQVGTDWLVVANDDLAWQPGAVDALVGAVERWPDAGVLGPAILTPDGSLYPSARALPSLGRGIGHALCGWWWPGNPWTRAYRQERGTPTERDVGWLSGSCLLLRAAAFDAVGGFDPSYFMYFEDLDLCERIGRAGWRNVYVPDAVVAHIGGLSTNEHRTEMVTAHHRSAYRYLSRRYAGLRWLPVRLVLRVGLGGRSLLSRLIHGIGEGARPTRSASVLADRHSH
jgi:N-acetylglucosaminyl-diphospho-decaprenol L-rhamnosyltransferase